jgi:hypothetical protein
MLDTRALVLTDQPIQQRADDARLDVSDVARRFGFGYPLRLTAALWADLVAIPAPQHGTQHVERRLGELLWMAAVAMRWAPADCSTITFTLALAVVGRDDTRYPVSAVCEIGDDGAPIITLLRADAAHPVLGGIADGDY